MSYILIPEHVRYDLSLPPMAIVIYGELMRLCREGGGSTVIKNEELAELYGRDVNTVSTYIKLLCTRGYFRAEYPGIRRRLIPAFGKENEKECRTG